MWQEFAVQPSENVPHGIVVVTTPDTHGKKSSEAWNADRKTGKELSFLFLFFLVLFVFGFALFRRGTLGKINFETENVQGLEFWIGDTWQPIKRPNMYLLASLICWPK